MPASAPPNEAQRLEALRAYEILDTPPEVAFERLTSLTAQLFEAPMALVSFVDADRQWFKSCFGVDAQQTDRKLSFCAYTILTDQVTVVPDALLDPRFLDNALVKGEPHIRFYAGAPLKTPDGQNLGSLCIIDLVPRQFSSEQQVMLANLASIVVDELELRRTARELRESETTLHQVLRQNSQLVVAMGNSKSGVVITDPQLPDNPLVLVNPAFCAMTGYTSEEILGRNCRFLQGPATDPAIRQELREAIANGRPWQGILLNYRKDGTPFNNELIMNPVFDEVGQLLSFVGLQNDVSEREQARQLLEEVVDERTAELAQSQIEILSRLARAAEYRDDDTGQHTKRVARTAALLAHSLGWDQEQVSMIEEAAQLHDVGKIAISDLILLKPGKLTEEEFEIMKTHTTIGAEMLSEGRSAVIRMAEWIAGNHHERWDGRGYPQGLAGEQIPIEGRILAIADVFDALTHERPYKKAWSIPEAVAEITSQKAKQFCPGVVGAFLTLPFEDLV